MAKLILLIVAVATAAYPASQVALLYLVNGTTRVGEITVQKVNLASGMVSAGPSLSTNAGGAHFILLDYDSRFLAVIGSDAATIMSMDDPSTLIRFPVVTPENQTWSFSGFLKLPDQSLSLLVATISANPIVEHLYGFALTSTAKPEALSSDVLSYLRSSGTFGTALFDDPLRSLFLFEENGKIKFQPGSLNIPAPPLRKSANPRQDLFPLVANDEAMVMTTPEEQTFSRDAMGSTVFHIFSRANKVWGAITIPGSATTVRAFGNWLAFVESENTQHWATTQSPGLSIYDPGVQRRSPGQAGRLSTMVPGTGKYKSESVDGWFEQGFYYPGALVIYNLQTGKEYTILTHQGDSEILLVSGTDVYYRVNTSIFRVDIDGDKLGNAVKLATDDLIGNSHRAFMTGK